MEINNNSPMTIGEYLSLLIDETTKNPEITSQPLYSKNGILFGYEDEEDTSKRMGVPVEQIRTWVNIDILPGVRSNDHLIIPKRTEKPKPNDIFVCEYVDRYAKKYMEGTSIAKDEARSHSIVKKVEEYYYEGEQNE